MKHQFKIARYGNYFIYFIGSPSSGFVGDYFEIPSLEKAVVDHIARIFLGSSMFRKHFIEADINPIHGYRSFDERRKHERLLQLRSIFHHSIVSVIRHNEVLFLKGRTFLFWCLPACMIDFDYKINLKLAFGNNPDFDNTVQISACFLYYHYGFRHAYYRIIYVPSETDLPDGLLMWLLFYGPWPCGAIKAVRPFFEDKRTCMAEPIDEEHLYGGAYEIHFDRRELDQVVELDPIEEITEVSNSEKSAHTILARAISETKNSQFFQSILNTCEEENYVPWYEEEVPSDWSEDIESEDPCTESYHSDDEHEDDLGAEEDTPGRTDNIEPEPVDEDELIRAIKDQMRRQRKE